ncbi:MAG: molybdopterin molybdotransferase MoeA [Eggerthellaceae bacterium]|nr:molybdopterin molybdotransferase MoeA [Eggerthellaceae bacterium]
MRDHSGYIEKDRHEAMQDVLDAWEFERGVETVEVPDALGRVAAADVVSKNTLPNKLTSNMDGIAVNFDAFEGGAPDTSAWVRGSDWQFCNTGIGMPGDFDTAIPIEWVEVSADDEHVVLNRLPEHRGNATTPVGANLQKGDVLVRAGDTLTPALLGVLNMGGHVQVDVVKRPVVAFIPTGNELVDAGKRLAKGKNVESNAVMVCAKLQQWGAEPLRYPIVPDNWKKLEKALLDAAEKADIVVINAGSSKGSDDFTCEILQEHGRMFHHMLAQGPGRHCSAAMLGATPVIGISGPPMGAEFTTDWMVKPLVDRYLGLSGAYPPMVFAQMDFAPDFWPEPVQVVKRGVVYRDEDDRLHARLLPMDGRPVLRTLDQANCFITFGRGVERWQAGDIHPVELRWPYVID